MHFILRDSIRVDTPATDAFLAEVRAQGGAKALEDFAEFNIQKYRHSMTSTQKS